MVLAYQTSGEFLRWNPHFHCLVLEGGFDERGRFLHIPLGDIQRMSEYFRRVVIRLLRGPFDRRSGVFNPSPPSPLPIHRSTPIEENGVATVVSYTSDNKFFKAKSEAFPLMRFFLELTQHLPLKGCQYIRRYGLYTSGTKGKWQHQPCVMRLAPAGWKKQQQQTDQDVQPYDAEAMYAVSDKESRSTWARLIAQVYEVDPLTCSRCGSPMRILAVITEPEEVRKVTICLLCA